MLTDRPVDSAAAEQDRADAAAGVLLGKALRRARWTIFWERLWPALASAGDRGRPVPRAVLARPVAVAAAARPRRRRCSSSPSSRVAATRAVLPAAHARHATTACAGSIAAAACRIGRRPPWPTRSPTPTEDPLSVALWNAHFERALTAARSLKAGMPAPRVAARDPYALRGLVAVLVIATFFAAGGDRWKRIAAAFDWQGVVLPANFRIDAWVTPPTYTGKPPIILPGMRPGEMHGAARTRPAAGSGSGRQHARRARDRQGRSRRHRRAAA